MPFQPVVPTGGVVGWNFLNRTMEAQRAAFTQTESYQRDEDYFRANIGGIRSAEELVEDRRLLSFALDAFGLGDDIGNKYFIQKVLEDGTEDAAALSNRLSDKRYKEFSDAFGFGAGQFPRNQLSFFSDEIVAKNEDSLFEEAVGNVDGDLRIALNLRRELSEIATDDMSETAKFYTVLGNPPLRTAFETAFRLPSAFATLDIDKQVETLQDRVESSFGAATISQFSDDDLTERLVQQFLVQSDIQSFEATSSPAAIALALLQ
ncbi:DUF1217 domain-containing protein [Dinoroseobacter sp. S124A]|uniref:DUF1217 domain-containing protein n=1 Tax=Dinoroseobacter sp. S124A TaxID=3415128 RepID=UPI003C7CD43C